MTKFRHCLNHSVEAKRPRCTYNISSASGDSIMCKITNHALNQAFSSILLRCGLVPFCVVCNVTLRPNNKNKGNILPCCLHNRGKRKDGVNCKCPLALSLLIYGSMCLLGSFSIASSEWGTFCSQFMLAIVLYNV